MGLTLNRYFFLLMMSISLMMGACNTIKPFFIKNKKKENRKEKHVSKKIDRKQNKIDKKKDKLDELKNTIAKIDSIPTVKRDTLVIRPLDTAYANTLIRNQHIEYETYHCKAKMHLESEENKQNFNIVFRIKKDSVIWASINAPIIGEVARAFITPDSVKAFERINKRYYLYSYKDIQKLINLEVDFKTLQQLIIGNVIATEGSITDIKDLGSLTNIFIKGLDYTNQLSYAKQDSSLQKLQLQTSRPSSSSSLLITMNQYQWIDLRHVAFLRQYNILDVKGAIELDMDINSVEFNQKIELPFNIPKNFSLAD